LLLKPEVYSIIYTASIENLEEFETVYRLEDGENAPTLLVSSNANQFIYEPTTLSPKPSGQSITIRAQRKNLATIDTPITIFASSSIGYEKLNGTSGVTPLGHPDISGSIVTSNGVSTYVLTAQQFSASFASNSFDEVTYEFTGSDVFGVEQSDEITISKVINFDGVSINLSNESTAFRANSVGSVLDDFSIGDGEVEVRIGNVIIEHNDGLTESNTFDIISATPLNVVESNPTYGDEFYGISNLTADSGSLVLDIKYLAGDGTTSQTFKKKVNYTKNRIAPPTITIDTTNKTQNVDAKSTGVQITSFEDSILTVKEIYTGSNTTFLETDVDLSFDLNPNTVANKDDNLTISYSNLGDLVDSSQVQFTVTVTDSEGVDRTISDSVSLSKSKNAPPNVLVTVSPQSQTVDSGSAADDIVISVKEGTTNYSYEAGTLTENTFKISSVSTGFSNSTSTITLDSNPTLTTSGTATISYVNSEGTADSEVVSFTIGVAKQGRDGIGASTIELNPPSQEVSVDVNDLISNTIPFSVQVYDSNGIYTYDDTLSTNGSFKITGISDSNGDGTSTNTNSTIFSAKPASTLGNLVTFDVTYKDRDGNTSDPIEKTHSIRVIAEGSTGPGIVFTGPWENTRTYQYDIASGRRDAVLYSGRYYATLQSHTNQAPEVDGNAYWQDLGTDDFFVAAKIAIFDDSFIKNTLNIGATDNGALSSANITLNGTDIYPYFSLGQSAETGTQEYGANGIFIGRHDINKNTNAANGAYVMSFSNGTNWLKWNGSTLDIKGSITATTGTISDSVTIGGTTAGNLLGPGDAAGDINSSPPTTTISGDRIRTGNIQANNFNGVTDGSDFSTNGSNFDLLNGTITTPSFRIDGTGNAFFSGNISTGANIDGANITGGTLTGGQINGTTFSGATGTFSGVITAESGEIGGWSIDNGELYTDEMALNSNRPALEIYSGTSLAVDINSSTTLSSLGAASGNTLNISPQADGDVSNKSNFGWGTSYTIPTTTIEASYTSPTTISTSGLAGQILTFAYDTTDDERIYYATLNMTNLQDPTTTYFQTPFIGINITCVLELVSGGSVVTTLTAYSLNGPDLPLMGNTQGQYSVNRESDFYPESLSKSTSFTANGGTYSVRARTIVSFDATFYSSVYAPNAYATTLSVNAYTAGFSNVRVFKEVSKTEVNAGGLQVVRSTTEYVIMDRLSSGTMLQVGGNITATGNITAYYSSDNRLKENIIPIVNPFDKIDKIGGYEFDWKPEFEEIHNSEGHDVGLIAQEIQKSMPELVGEMNGGFLGVKYEKLTVYLLEAVKNLNNRLIELEEENKKLKEDN